MQHRETESHCTEARCAATPSQALAFLADGLELGHWSLGCWQTVAVGGGVVEGRSLFDGAPHWVRPVADVEQLEVTYHVGSAPDALRPRIHARVVPDPATGGCCVSLHAARTASMDDARWQRLVRCHEVEILLIQARLAARTGAPLP